MVGTTLATTWVKRIVSLVIKDQGKIEKYFQKTYNLCFPDRKLHTLSGTEQCRETLSF